MKTTKNFAKRKLMVTTLMFVAMLTVMQFVNEHPVLGFQWSVFQQKLNTFFKDGLGGPGAQGIGLAIVVIGVVCAVISFVVHKFNPQSRMPGWITCIVIALIGAVIMDGVGDENQGLVKFVKESAASIKSMFGI